MLHDTAMLHKFSQQSRYFTVIERGSLRLGERKGWVQRWATLSPLYTAIALNKAESQGLLLPGYSGSPPYQPPMNDIKKSNEVRKKLTEYIK